MAQSYAFILKCILAIGPTKLAGFSTHNQATHVMLIKSFPQSLHMFDF